MNRSPRQLRSLLQRCQGGDEEALEELIRTWERRLFYYVRRLVDCEADAWDVLQQTWTRVVKSIARVRDLNKFAPWLYRTARNAALSHRKSVLAKEQWVDRDASVNELAGVDILEQDWTAEDVHLGLERLSAHHREVLTLFFLQDLSIDEIAEVLGVPDGTVKSRLYYAKKALRHEFENNEDRK